MQHLRAFLLGTIAVGLCSYALVAALAVAAQASGSTLDLSLGPVIVVAVERVGGVTTTTFGSGLVVVAAVGGVANALAALLVRRRAVRRAGRVN